MKLIAERLLDEGHSVAMALQQIDALGTDGDPRIQVWQGPVWPRLLVSAAQDHSRPVATMGDILARLGLDRPGCLAAMVSGWDAIFTGFQPDVVIAEYAPTLLMAARGRIPAIQAGEVFACPPHDAPYFPNLSGHAVAYDEAALLDIADADLASVGRGPLASLPALFAADTVLISGFVELDPYRGSPGRRHCAPLILPPTAEGTGGGGEELFVYGLNRFAPDHPLWAALKLLKRPVRIHMLEPLPEHLALFRQAGFAFEARPVPFPRIAQRSALALSYGGHGFVSACLLAALPHFIMSFDLEKRLIGNQIAVLGFGDHCEQLAIDPPLLADRIEALANDTQTAQRLRDAAPDFHARMSPSLEDEIVRMVATL